MYLILIQDFFHKNMHIIEKKDIFDQKVFILQRFSKFFSPNGGVNIAANTSTTEAINSPATENLH